jgi:hypothetical protein
MRYQPTADTLSVIQRLGGVWSGRHAMVRCPAHDDRTPSLSIRQGRNSILVHCFAGCEGAAVMRGIRQVLGHTIPDQRAIPEPANDREPPFRRIWTAGVGLEGTLGHRYLRDVRGIGSIPPDVRFHPHCPMGKGKAVRFHPALLVGVFRRSDLIAVQRLFLDPQTAVRTARMMLGNSRGGLWPSRFSFPDIAIAEGFESACAYRQLTGREAGTCFGVRNFASFEVPSGVSRLVLLPDNDDEGQGFAAHALVCREGVGADWAIQSCPSSYGDWAEMVRPREGVSLSA